MTPLHLLFETVVDEANKLGVRVTGSELVGLIPKEAILETGRYFLKKANRATNLPEREIIQVAIKTLGLDELAPFDVDEKVIEYKIDNNIVAS